MTQIIIISNNGSEILSTNYFETDFSKNGFCYLSGNAGAARLLVPKILNTGLSCEDFLVEISTAKSVMITKKMVEAKECIEILFEDFSNAPFVLLLSDAQSDRHVPAGLRYHKIIFKIYTETCVQKEFSGFVNTNKDFNYA